MSKTHMFFGGMATGSGIWAQWPAAQIAFLVAATIIALHGCRTQNVNPTKERSDG